MLKGSEIHRCTEDTAKALLWNPENIDLQHSFAQSMAEMGQLECYKRSQNC